MGGAGGAFGAGTRFHDFTVASDACAGGGAGTSDLAEPEAAGLVGAAEAAGVAGAGAAGAAGVAGVAGVADFAEAGGVAGFESFPARPASYAERHTPPVVGMFDSSGAGGTGASPPGPGRACFVGGAGTATGPDSRSAFLLAPLEPLEPLEVVPDSAASAFVEAAPLLEAAPAVFESGVSTGA